jgi:hypothetical protein
VIPPRPPLHADLPTPANDARPFVRWWETLEFLALAEVRHAMVRGVVPAKPAETAEESARHAVFWALFELDSLVRHFAARIEAGERVRIRTGILKHEGAWVELSLRIVKEANVPGGGP